jgi:hypothetical protein
MVNRESLEQWIENLFNHQEHEGDWRYSLDVDEPEFAQELILECIIVTFNDFKQYLSRFNDWQLALGLEYIFNNGYSNFVFTFKDISLPINLRLKAIRSIKYLFRDCFDLRCHQSLGHLSELGGHLNYLCYMLWDISPLTYWVDDHDSIKLYEAVSEVMEYSLYLSNIACIESGLHGLGHIVSYYQPAVGIIESFIECRPDLDKRLVQYAKQAKTGCIL